MAPFIRDHGSGLEEAYNDILEGGKKVILRGDPSLTKGRVSLKSMLKSWSSSDLGF